MNAQNGEAYCVNLGCIRRWPSEKARSWCREAVARLQCNPEVLAIIAVGSAIRDVATSSDVDLVVIYSGSRPDIGHPPLDVDIRLYEASSVPELLATGHDYLVWAVRLGALVFQRDSYWTRIRDRWLQEAPWPDPHAARERAERARQLQAELASMGDRDAALEQQISMLTHLARARLLEQQVFPASRPELPDQLESIGERNLAQKLRAALQKRESDIALRGRDRS